ncbi:MAG: DUF222 domain-containing protein, partial [Acidimicrobiia bacterium]|nr:DUF222 domain-containing protein [Acidimicrobiia bacterium]
MTSRRRRMNRVEEERAFRDRYVTLQPTLDESAWTLSGRLPGMLGRVVDKAISQKADELRLLPDAEASTRAQRQADALVMMLQDALEHDDCDVDTSRGSGHVTVFVDARSTDPEDVTTGIPFGPNVGPNVLETLMCDGTVRVIGMDDGEPIATSHSTRVIQPAVRDAVLFRDDGCTIDGCASRYRLEPHHIVPWSEGGTHDPSNLTTLCWYHHHVAIHGHGYHIDPDSPPQRRRLTPNNHRGPPP